MKKAETYEELIRTKRCVDLTEYYGLSESDLDKIYLFLETNPFGIIKGGLKNLALVTPDDPKNHEIIIAKCINPKVEGIFMTNDSLSIIPRVDRVALHSQQTGINRGNVDEIPDYDREIKL